MKNFKFSLAGYHTEILKQCCQESGKFLNVKTRCNRKIFDFNMLYHEITMLSVDKFRIQEFLDKISLELSAQGKKLRCNFHRSRVGPENPHLEEQVRETHKGTEEVKKAERPSGSSQIQH